MPKTAPMVKTGRKRRNAGRRKTEKHLYNALGCNRDNFTNSILMTRKMHDKKYNRYKPKGFEVLFTVHTDTEHIHVHFLVSNCNFNDGK